MQVEQKDYLRQFEMENMQDPGHTREYIMKQYEKQVINVDLTEMWTATHIFDSKHANYQFKVLVFGNFQEGLRKYFSAYHSLEVWTSIDEKRPYKKTYQFMIKEKVKAFCVYNYLLAFVVEKSNNLYLFNMITKEELRFTFPFIFSDPEHIFMSNKSVFITKDKKILYIYNLLHEDQEQPSEKFLFLDSNQDQSNISMGSVKRVQVEPIDIRFNTDVKNIKTKTIKVEHEVNGIFADDDRAVVTMVRFNENLQSMSKGTTVTDPGDENDTSRSLKYPKQKSMVKLRVSASPPKNPYQAPQQKHDLIFILIDLENLATCHEHTVESDQVSVPIKYFQIPHFTKIEVIICTDDQQEPKFFILQNKIPKGFQMTEIERDVTTPLFDSNDNITDWYFERDTRKLIIKQIDNQGQEVVKVFPLQNVVKNPSMRLEYEKGLDKYMDMVQSSRLSFQDEVLSQLDGKTLFIQSYIINDNFLFIAYANVISVINLSSICFNDTQWKHFVRKRSNLINDSSVYLSIDDFKEDVMYLYLSNGSLFTTYKDNKKHVFTIVGDQIKVKDVDIIEINKPALISECVISKGIYYSVVVAEDLPHQLAIYKPDSKDMVQKHAISIQILDPENYHFMINRSLGLIALLYVDQVYIYKVSYLSGEPIQNVIFDKELPYSILQNIQSYQLDQKFIYILSQDTMYVIDMEQSKLNEPQNIGVNVKHFMIFDNQYIYWLEKNEQISSVYFDYFDPQKQTQLLKCLIFEGANQLNFKKVVRYDDTSKRMILLFSTTKIKIFPPLHLNYVELLGYDLTSTQRKCELTLYQDNKLALLNQDNYLKMWNLEDARVIKNEYYSHKNYSNKIVKQLLSRGCYLLQDMVDSKMYEYMVIKMDFIGEPSQFTIQEPLKFLFHHNQVSKIRGTNELLKLGTDFAHMVVLTVKGEENSYSIYKFLDTQDENGYRFYEVVTLITHTQFLLFSPNFHRFCEYDEDMGFFKIQKVNLESKNEKNDIKEKLLSMKQNSDYFFRVRNDETPLFSNYDQMRLVHKNFSTTIIDIPPESLTSNFKYMKPCPMTLDFNWPVAFPCEKSIVIIIDKYIVKKFYISDNNSNLLEAQIVVDWKALMQYPQFTSETPSFYYIEGTIFTQDQFFSVCTNITANTNCGDSESIWNYINELKQGGIFQNYPLNFELEQMMCIYMVENQDLFVADYMYRSANNRYKKRKRIIYNFTFFDWLLIQNLKSIYQDIDIPQNVLRKACLSVLPGRQNILFQIYNDYQLLNYVFQAVQGTTKEDNFFIPFLKDINGKTPLHYCLSNAKISDLFLNYLAQYPISYYTSNMTELVPYLIIKGLQKTNMFLDSRFLPTPLMKQFDRERLNIIPDAGFSLTGKNSFWFEKREEIASDTKLFKEDEFQLPTQLTLLDLPRAHFGDSQSMNIFTALRVSQSDDIFESQAVRAIIEHTWPRTRMAIIRWMMIPNVVFLFFFIIYTTIIFEHNEFRQNQVQQDETEGGDPEIQVALAFWKVLNRVCIAGLIAFILYFIGIEIVQAYKNVRTYLSSPWNYLDVFTILFILLTSLLDFLDVSATVQRPLFAIATLIMWLKTLYYLRIFRSVGYLTSMIIMVFLDMRYFFIILVMSIFAFGNTFYMLSLNNTEENKFIHSYPEGLAFTFNMILGNFNTDSFGNQDVLLVWVFFIMASILQIIVLLNLLISIISDSYGRIQGNSRNSMYRELATLIDDNDFLTEHDPEMKQYLLVAKPDNDYLNDIAEEKAPTKEGLIMETVNLLTDEIKEIKIMLVQQRESQAQMMEFVMRGAEQTMATGKDDIMMDHLGGGILQDPTSKRDTMIRLKSSQADLPSWMNQTNNQNLYGSMKRRKESVISSGRMGLVSERQKSDKFDGYVGAANQLFKKARDRIDDYTRGRKFTVFSDKKLDIFS